MSHVACTLFMHYVGVCGFRLRGVTGEWDGEPLDHDATSTVTPSSSEEEDVVQIQDISCVFQDANGVIVQSM